MCIRTGGFQMPGIIYIILYCKNVCNYITYDVHIKPHKTCGWSPTPFLIYTFENPGCGCQGHSTPTLPVYYSAPSQGQLVQLAVLTW